MLSELPLDANNPLTCCLRPCSPPKSGGQIILVTPWKMTSAKYRLAPLQISPSIARKPVVVHVAGRSERTLIPMGRNNCEIGQFLWCFQDGGRLIRVALLLACQHSSKERRQEPPHAK